jgi:4'-phosphopantetheinyl transferase
MNATPQILWSPVAGPSRLHPGDVHVWCAPLDEAAGTPAACEALLSGDERRRAQRLRFARDRQRFVTARGLLREILASYLAAPPEELRFAYGPGGKPRLVQPAATRELQFNLSHCGGLALYAVTWGEPVGVDLEQVRPMSEMTLIARRYFRPSESDLLHRLGPDRRDDIFFQIWTQREALAKARGVGLAEALESPDDSASRPRSAPPWLTIRLQPVAGYTAAVALAAANPRLQCGRWITRLPAETASRPLVADCA